MDFFGLFFNFHKYPIFYHFFSPLDLSEVGSFFQLFRILGSPFTCQKEAKANRSCAPTGAACQVMAPSGQVRAVLSRDT